MLRGGMGAVAECEEVRARPRGTRPQMGYGRWPWYCSAGSAAPVRAQGGKLATVRCCSAMDKQVGEKDRREGRARSHVRWLGSSVGGW